MNTAQIVAALMLAGCLWAVLCRLAAITWGPQALRPILRLFFLGCGCAGALMVPGDAALGMLSGGVFAHLLLGAEWIPLDRAQRASTAAAVAIRAAARARGRAWSSGR